MKFELSEDQAMMTEMGAFALPVPEGACGLELRLCGAAPLMARCST